jgi:DNA-binding FadR family transcriptional regulator
MIPKRVPLYRQAQEQLKTYIQIRNLGAGAPLPPESQLAEELGMSRLSLREATKSLEALGVLEARQGEGVFVSQFSFAPILDNLPYGLFVYGKSLQDLFQVRRGLEEGLAGNILTGITSSDFQTLEALVEEMAAHARNGQPIVEPDRAFHLALFRPLDNPLLLRLIELFWDAYHRLRKEVVVEPSDPNRVHAIHAAIVQALRSGDVDRVRAAMVGHFAMIPPGVAPLSPTPSAPVAPAIGSGRSRPTSSSRRRSGLS